MDFGKLPFQELGFEREKQPIFYSIQCVITQQETASVVSSLPFTCYRDVERAQRGSEANPSVHVPTEEENLIFLTITKE